jgi:NADH-quinone oxidoreductase subunit C
MLVEKLKTRFGDFVTPGDTSRGEEVIIIPRARASEVFRVLRDNPDFAFNFLTDLTAVDWLEREPRFEVVYNLNSLTLNHRLRVKVPLPGVEPWTNSVVELWDAANWLERECYDMFGIEFRGHPDLRRILLYDSFVGHPLRRDYPYNKRQPLEAEVDPVTNPRHMSR